jgi:hypothetical protein
MGGEEQPPKAILSKEGAYSLKMSYSGSTLYGGINGNEASAAVSTPESWHHYAMTYNSSRIALYIDGMYAGGAIDEVRVYSRSLSAQEVWLHYQTEFAKYNSTTYRFYSNVTNLSDGTYTYYGWANDSVGNWAYTSTYTAGSPRYLFVDWHAPVVSLASPGNNTAWTAVGNLSFTYNVSDYSSISFCNLSFNGVVNQSVLSVAKDVNQSFNVSLPNGLYNWSVNCTDAEGFNGFSGVFSLTVDTIVPALNFTSPTEENGTTITRNWTQANISINEPNLDTFKFNWNGTNYSIYDDSLVLALNFNNNSAIGECFDNETEVYTDGGWKYFQDLNRSEKVLTLNQKTLEPEWQAPTAWETFDNDREMYNISLEDGSSLLVSPEHRVYGSFGVVISPSFCSSSFVSNTSTVFCFLSGWSCDQMGQQCFSDSAKYSTSSGSGVISLASFKNSFISESGAILTCSLTAKNSDRRSLSDRRVLEMISGQYFPISSSAYSGAIGVILSEKNSLCLLPLAMRSDMSTLASTTTSISTPGRLS